MARYTDALSWIALNDAPGDDDNAADTAGYLTVCLVADLFNKEPYEVARKVVHLRRRWLQEIRERGAKPTETGA